MKRWASFPISVYADSLFRQEDVVASVDLWNSAMGTAVFRIVANESEASIIMNHDWPPPGRTSPLPENACGTEGPRGFNGNVIISGGGNYAFGIKPSCNFGSQGHQMGLAHGLGHIITLGHTNPYGTSDVMIGDGARNFFRVSPLLVEVVRWLSVVPAGTRPV